MLSRSESSITEQMAALPYGNAVDQQWAYISIDLETTGLNPEEDQILEFGAVADDLKTPVHLLPAFNRIIVPHDYRVDGNAIALTMNKDIIAMIADIAKNTAVDHIEYCFPHELVAEFKVWLTDIGWNEDSILCAGKNFASFDRPFLDNYIDDWASKVRIRHRTIDPVNIFYQPFTDMTRPPGMAECCRRAGIDDHVTHRAVDDARMVIRLVRKGYEIE